MLPTVYVFMYLCCFCWSKQIVYARCHRLWQPKQREEEEGVEDEEDINLLNYCCDHNFNDTKIKKPLRPQSGGGNIIHKRGKWSRPTTKASGSRWQWLPEKFPLNLLTIFASHKLSHTHTHKYTLVETHTHTH